MSRLSELGGRLYRGEASYDFVGKRKTWYLVSAVLLALAVAGLLGRGLNLGIEFRGGAEYQFAAGTATVEQARAVVTGEGIEGAIVTQLTNQLGSSAIRIQTPDLTTDESEQLVAALAAEFGLETTEIDSRIIGPSWGADITNKAVQALLWFLVLVAGVLALIFEWRMAVAALVALAHDVVITVGIYALSGFEVTPSTVIGVLTILGYSLYDTVVVFDKVKENTKGITSQNRLTYSDAANLALNQTIVRSINTSIVALLPVTAILFIGAGVLGAGTLRDLSLSLFIGMLVGAYSSIVIATPVLAQLKEKQEDLQQLARRVQRGGHHGVPQVATAQESVAAATAVDAGPVGPRNQPRRVARSKRK